MPNPPVDAEKITNPPGGGETTPPVAETETISKDELTRLRNKVGATERLLQEAQGIIAAQQQKEQLEALVLRIAESQKIDPNLLMKYAPKRTPEELEELAKDLPKSGEKSGYRPTLNSGRSSGGETTFTRAQIADRAFYEANKEAILQANREGRIKE